MIWFRSLLIGLAAAIVTAIVTAMGLPAIMTPMMMCARRKRAATGA